MTSARDRSYSKHDELAELIGARKHAHGYRPNIFGQLRDGSVVIIRSTSNAGFNGITAFVENAEGKTSHMSLGDVIAFVTCDACDELASEWGDDGGLYCSEHVGMGGSDIDDDFECCANCGRDFEGCECSADEGGIGHDSFEEVAR